MFCLFLILYLCYIVEHFSMSLISPYIFYELDFGVAAAPTQPPPLTCAPGSTMNRPNTSQPNISPRNVVLSVAKVLYADMAWWRSKGRLMLLLVKWGKQNNGVEIPWPTYPFLRRGKGRFTPVATVMRGKRGQSGEKARSLGRAKIMCKDAKT
jgi:hypothetical protein